MPSKYGMGCLFQEDPRDEDYVYSSPRRLAEPPRTYRYWWTSGWHGDQGATPRCVGFGWAHLLYASPTNQYLNPNGLYKMAQKFDPWAAQQHDGTTVRAAAEVLKDLGVITGYQWVRAKQDLIYHLLYVGPVVIGVDWKKGMMNLDADGFIHPFGPSVGGHCVIIKGINVVKDWITIKNSWGTNWCNGGYATMYLTEFWQYLSGGEICLPMEVIPSP